MRAYLKDINKAINADIRIPSFYEVGNAVGALAGKIIHRTEILIRPSTPKKEEYAVFSKLGKEVFENYSEALDYGIRLSHRLVLEYMERYGLDMNNVKFNLIQDDVESMGKFPLETCLVGTGVGTIEKLV